MSVFTIKQKDFVPSPLDSRFIRFFLRKKDESIYSVSKNGIKNLSEYNSLFYRIPIDEIIQEDMKEEEVFTDDKPEGYRVLFLKTNIIHEKYKNEKGEFDWFKESIPKHGCIVILKPDINNPNELDSYYLFNKNQWEKVYYSLSSRHLNDKNNPHKVTKEQVGLGMVENILQASKYEFDTHVKDDKAHGITKEQVGLGLVPNVKQCTYEQFITHASETGINKVHGYDKISVGLGLVPNKKQVTGEQFNAHSRNYSNPHHVTPLQIGLDKILPITHATKENFDAHANNFQNPHKLNFKQISGLENLINVEQATAKEFDTHVKDDKAHGITKEQIGLGNVDNKLQLINSTFQKHEENLKFGDNATEYKLNNPHQVTKISLGLKNVVNQKQIAKSIFDNHISIKTINPHGMDSRDVIPSLWSIADSNYRQVTLKEFNDHTNNLNADGTPNKNPHNLSATNFGLYNVEDTLQADVDLVKNHILIKNDGVNNVNPHKVTKKSIGLSNVINEEQVSEFTFMNHTKKSQDDPHEIKKEDIEGIENINNTSAYNKPLSTAQINELKNYQDFSISKNDILLKKESSQSPNWTYYEKDYGTDNYRVSLTPKAGYLKVTGMIMNPEVSRLSTKSNHLVYGGYITSNSVVIEGIKSYNNNDVNICIEEIEKNYNSEIGDKSIFLIIKEDISYPILGFEVLRGYMVIFEKRYLRTSYNAYVKVNVENILTEGNSLDGDARNIFLTTDFERNSFFGEMTVKDMLSFFRSNIVGHDVSGSKHFEYKDKSAETTNKVGRRMYSKAEIDTTVKNFDYFIKMNHQHYGFDFSSIKRSSNLRSFGVIHESGREISVINTLASLNYHKNNFIIENVSSLNTHRFLLNKNISTLFQESFLRQSFGNGTRPFFYEGEVASEYKIRDGDNVLMESRLICPSYPTGIAYDCQKNYGVSEEYVKTYNNNHVINAGEIGIIVKDEAIKDAKPDGIYKINLTNSVLYDNVYGKKIIVINCHEFQKDTNNGKYFNIAKGSTEYVEDDNDKNGKEAIYIKTEKLKYNDLFQKTFSTVIKFQWNKDTRIYDKISFLEDTSPEVSTLTFSNSIEIEGYTVYTGCCKTIGNKTSKTIRHPNLYFKNLGSSILSISSGYKASESMYYDLNSHYTKIGNSYLEDDYIFTISPIIQIISPTAATSFMKMSTRGMNDDINYRNNEKFEELPIIPENNSRSALNPYTVIKDEFYTDDILFDINKICSISSFFLSTRDNVYGSYGSKNLISDLMGYNIKHDVVAISSGSVPNDQYNRIRFSEMEFSGKEYYYDYDEKFTRPNLYRGKNAFNIHRNYGVVGNVLIDDNVYYLKTNGFVIGSGSYYSHITGNINDMDSDNFTLDEENILSIQYFPTNEVMVYNTFNELKIGTIVPSKISGTRAKLKNQRKIDLSKIFVKGNSIASANPVYKIFYIRSFINFTLILSYTVKKPYDIIISYFDHYTEKIIQTGETFFFGYDIGGITSSLTSGCYPTIRSKEFNMEQSHEMIYNYKPIFKNNAVVENAVGSSNGRYGGCNYLEIWGDRNGIAIPINGDTFNDRGCSMMTYLNKTNQSYSNDPNHDCVQHKNWNFYDRLK